MRCAFNYTGPGSQSAVNVMHFRTHGGGASPAGLATAIEAAIDSGVFWPMSNEALVTDLAITPLDGATPTYHYTPVTPANWTGGSSGGPLIQVATLLKFSTATRGRSYRGRLFLPFVSESNIENGALDGTIAADWQNDFQDFIADVSGDGVTPADLVVASYKHATAATVMNVQAEIQTGSQRRRQGRNRAA